MSRTLTVYLAADLKRFSPQLRDAENDLGRFGRGVDGLSNNLTRMLGPALIGAAAAAGVAAVAFGVEGVKAFVEDEAAAAKLATTLDNLGLAHETAPVEAMIDAMQRQTGVADDALRPAFDRLVRSIGNTAGATDALKLAMDVSAGTGKSLDSIVQALGKAYDGNTTGLGRLGAGLDKATLATGDMRLITEQLSRTFSGQAQTAADTYQGQLNRLAVGFGELQESFGAGFLSSLDNTTQGTNDLMDAMKDLEPAMRDLGVTASKAAVGLAKFASESANVVDGAIAMADEPSWDGLIKHLRNTFEATDQFKGAIGGIPGVGRFLEDVYDIVAGFIALDDAQGNDFIDIGGGEFGSAALTAGELSKVLSGTVGSAIQAGKATAAYGGVLVDYGRKVEATTGSTNALNKETGLLTTAFDLQRGVVEKLQGTLDSQVTDLEAATQAARDYSTTLASQLLGGIDLGAAQQTGTDLGITTLDAFDRQIAEAEWFGNVLSSIKAQGADQMLIDQLASLGPAAGGALAQEMLDKGLVQTFSDRLVDVVAVANTTAQAMVPEFLTAGIDSAEDFVDGTIEQLTKEQARLKAIGKNVGKGIGVNIKAEIAEAVADAVRAANAAKTAAAAERAAEIAAQQVTVSEQQIAQALQRLIGNSNARAGYSMGVPVPTPVLG
jgi:hypothetical protein